MNIYGILSQFAPARGGFARVITEEKIKNKDQNRRPIAGLSLLFAALYLGLMGQAAALEKVDKQVNISPETQVQIKVQRGEVQILSWDNPAVSVTGTLDELSEGFIFELQGNQLKIEDKMPQSYRGNGSNGTKLIIKVPNTVNLSADTVSANLQVSQTQGAVNLHSVSGNIHATQLAGSPSLQTISGKIVALNLDGNIQLETVSGAIEDTDSKGKISYRLVSSDLTSQSLGESIHVEQVSGEINATWHYAKEIELQSVSGDSQVSLANSLTQANFASVSGDITLSFTQLPDAEFKISGGPGGKIHNSLSQDKPQQPQYVPSASLSFQTGSGSAKVALDTISGSLSLKQQ
ncbi:MAG: DUF4097 family beta strand repeat-containing protein [Shewanella sp.]